MPVTRPYRSPRRAEDAATTRADILTAARDLFAERGYARVTVADIARAAGTAVKTVYASAGGKAGILAELLSSAVTGSRADETLAEVRAAGDLTAALTALARGTRWGNETHRVAIDIMYSAMSAQDDAERVWTAGTTAYRATLRSVAEHLATLGAVERVDRAADLLWFWFGPAAWRTLVRDCGWPWDEAERWLLDQALRAFTPGPVPPGPPSPGHRPPGTTPR
ncbi:MAG TPA: helix-turn-helix domain-containing protein [Pseudonocardiaceae bacterium]|jgi:AcrR family transcriptional regulator|nr:helix-turn-helix domain-containing protein [Pseudonocardiaceae bacterium]